MGRLHVRGLPSSLGVRSSWTTKHPVLLSASPHVLLPRHLSSRDRAERTLGLSCAAGPQEPREGQDSPEVTLSDDSSGQRRYFCSCSPTLCLPSCTRTHWAHTGHTAALRKLTSEAVWGDGERHGLRTHLKLGLKPGSASYTLCGFTLSHFTSLSLRFFIHKMHLTAVPPSELAWETGGYIERKSRTAWFRPQLCPH